MGVRLTGIGPAQSRPQRDGPNPRGGRKARLGGPGARRPASDRKADTPSWKGVALLPQKFLRTVAVRTTAAASIAAIAAVTAVPAGAASAPDAYVRIEGARATLVGQTLVRT